MEEKPGSNGIRNTSAFHYVKILIMFGNIIFFFLKGISQSVKKSEDCSLKMIYPDYGSEICLILDNQTGTRFKAATVAPLCASVPIMEIGNPRGICPLSAVSGWEGALR